MNTIETINQMDKDRVKQEAIEYLKGRHLEVIERDKYYLISSSRGLTLHVISKSEMEAIHKLGKDYMVESEAKGLAVYVEKE